MRAKKKHSKKILGPVLGLCLMTSMVSCGSDDDDDDDTIVQLAEQQQGVYRADLLPANPELDDNVSGTVLVSHLGDDFRVDMDVKGAPGGTHVQHIHAGSRCATMADDTNGDKIIDHAEATAVSGTPLLPLDSDLGRAEENSYKSGSSYVYNESASFALITSGVSPTATTGNDDSDNSPSPSGSSNGDGDDNPSASDIADTAGNGIPSTAAPTAAIPTAATGLASTALEGRVVEIHGVEASRTLPSTVAKPTGESAQESVPVACGILRRLTDATAAATPAPTPTATESGTGTGTTGTGTPAGTIIPSTSPIHTRLIKP